MKQIIQNLKKQHRILESDLAAKLKLAKDTQRDFDKHKNEADSVLKRISALEKIEAGDIKVSDHAIVRLMERRFGQGELIEQVRKQLIEEIQDRILDINCKINLKDGLQAVLENGCVVTVQPA